MAALIASIGIVFVAAMMLHLVYLRTCWRWPPYPDGF